MVIGSKGRVSFGQIQNQTTGTLTHNGESEGQTDLGLRRHLALVDPAVLLLHVAHLQLPVVGPLRMLRLEPLVVRVRHNPNGQNVKVPFPNPRHGTVAQVQHAAVQVGGLSDGRDDVSLGAVVKDRQRLAAEGVKGKVPVI